MENHMFQQLQTVKFLSRQKLGVKLVVGALVTISAASVVQTWAVWLLGRTILLGPFQLLSLWFCDHIRPVCPGSLTAMECVLRGGKQRAEPKCRPHSRSPRPQRQGAKAGEAGGPSLFASAQKSQTCSPFLPPSLSPFPLEISSCSCLARFPETFQRPAGGARPKSNTQGCRVSPWSSPQGP